MNVIRLLIGIPVAIIILVFAFVNNGLVTFSLWPFNIETTVSLSVVTIVLVVLGFLLGRLSAWFSYAPMRKELAKRKKENKKLSDEHRKLNDKVGSLQGDLENIKQASQTEQKTSSDKTDNKLSGFFSKLGKEK